MSTRNSARDHLAGLGPAGDCRGCSDFGSWAGDCEELDDVREAAGLPPRSRLEHALQWGRHQDWHLLSEDEDLVIGDEFDVDVLRLVRADRACVKTAYIDALLRKPNPTCGSKGCQSHENGPVLPEEPDSIQPWTGTTSVNELDDDALVLFSIGPAGEGTWTRVDEHVLWVVWLDQDEAVAARKDRSHKLLSRSLGLARRELHDQGDGLLVARGQHGLVSLRGGQAAVQGP